MARKKNTAARANKKLACFKDGLSNTCRPIEGGAEGTARL
jgi:hypothetical protein